MSVPVRRRAGRSAACQVLRRLFFVDGRELFLDRGVADHQPAPGLPVTAAGRPDGGLQHLLQASFKHLEHRISKAIDPDEAIRTYKRCVFVGDPGAGKTTLLKYLALKAADNQLANLPDLPIRIELNAFASSGHHDLLDFAAADWDERYGFPKADARPSNEATVYFYVSSSSSSDSRQAAFDSSESSSSKSDSSAAAASSASAPVSNNTAFVLSTRH